jgi:streptomycin 6-kinase
VAHAIRFENQSAVIKLSCDDELVRDEYKTLKHFNGHGSIQILDYFPQEKALLLQRAQPGCLLKENTKLSFESKVKEYASVVKQIASLPLLSQDNYPHVSKWCAAIGRVESDLILPDILSKAKEIKTYLISTMENTYLCHGDLHLENIVQHGTDWLSIDPKGIIGEVAFEAAAFDLLDKNEIMCDSGNASNILKARIEALAKILNLDCQRLLYWVFLRIIISAQWFIEDNGDPSEMLRLASLIVPLLDK